MFSTEDFHGLIILHLRNLQRREQAKIPLAVERPGLCEYVCQLARARRQHTPMVKTHIGSASAQMFFKFDDKSGQISQLSSLNFSTISRSTHNYNYPATSSQKARHVTQIDSQINNGRDKMACIKTRRIGPRFPDSCRRCMEGPKDCYK